ARRPGDLDHRADPLGRCGRNHPVGRNRPRAARGNRPRAARGSFVNAGAGQSSVIAGSVAASYRLRVDVEAQAVRDALTALDEAFERRDLEAALDLCTEDVVFIGSGDGEVAAGRDAIGPMFAALAPQLEHLR